MCSIALEPKNLTEWTLYVQDGSFLHALVVNECQPLISLYDVQSTCTFKEVIRFFSKEATSFSSN